MYIKNFFIFIIIYQSLTKFTILRRIGTFQIILSVNLKNLKNLSRGSNMVGST